MPDMPDVLLAEDDPAIATLLEELLVGMGFRVCGLVRTHRETVDAALRLKPDRMLVDARLGRDSGVDAMSEIERHGKVPHVFMSGGRVDGVRHAALLLKPFTELALERALKTAMLATRFSGSVGQ
jgi:DNA-binding response OmpR family regulator